MFNPKMLQINIIKLDLSGPSTLQINISLPFLDPLSHPPIILTRNHHIFLTSILSLPLKPGDTKTLLHARVPLLLLLLVTGIQLPTQQIRRNISNSYRLLFPIITTYLIYNILHAGATL